MAVPVYDNSVFVSSGNRDHSLTFTIAANAILFGILDCGGGGAIVSAMTANGNSMLSLGAGTNTDKIFGWILSAPPSGNVTIKMHHTGLFQHSWTFVSYTGHTANAAYGTVTPLSSGSANTFNFSASSTATDLVVYAIRATGTANAAFANNGTTRLSGSNSNVSRMILADLGGASSITLSCTVQTAATSWDGIAIPLHGASSVTVLPMKALLGVGF